MDIEWLADVPGAVRLHKDQWMLPQSALRGRVIARLRLQDIITKDRAACGDGRWVQTSERSMDPNSWKKQNARYRWEPRR